MWCALTSYRFPYPIYYFPFFLLEESGIVRLAKHFDLFADAASLSNAVSAIRDHLQSCQINN